MTRNIGLMKDTFGESPLIHAVKESNFELIDFILSQGGNINTKDTKGFTALMIGCMNGNQKIVLELVNKKADLAIENKQGYTAAMLSAMKGHNKLIKFLQQSGDKTPKHKLMSASLFYLARKGRVSKIQSILDSKEFKKGLVNINFSNEKKWTPLIVASQNGKLDVVKLLLKYSKNENEEENNNKIVNLNFASSLKTTALMHASRSGNHEIVKVLLNHKVDINAQDIRGYSSLHYAKNAETVVALKDGGIDVTLKDTQDRTAKQFWDNEELKKLL
ncbi:c2 domain containing protein [Anaeramoeba flamelloides]|uniref:C2 domain containing protein n=1 Tax=Anaeramoeba flamelloides TaxID=1746091 RepID=A0ABQ8X6M0_9EUKA|nr:c2 domain containing protein [Anaeramoeba flamelloides]